MDLAKNCFFIYLLFSGGGECIMNLRKSVCSISTKSQQIGNPISWKHALIDFVTIKKAKQATSAS